MANIYIRNRVLITTDPESSSDSEDDGIINRQSPAQTVS